MKSVMLLMTLLFVPMSLAAEELDQIFKRVQEMVQTKNYSKALNELTWARKEIEKMHTAQLQTFFPDELSGFKGSKVESNAALGFTSIERGYRNGNQSVKVSLTGGSGSSQGGFGNLAALGQMAALMGNQGGMDTFRISGRTATLEKNESGQSADLTVFLDSGSILKLEGSNGASAETLKQMAEALKLDELEKYLKG